MYGGVLLLVVVRGSGVCKSKPVRAPARTARARPWYATVVVAALAGLSVPHGVYLVVLGHAPL